MQELVSTQSNIAVDKKTDHFLKRLNNDNNKTNGVILEVFRHSIYLLSKIFTLKQ